jgi:pyruvate formate lyase activating enzyme
MIIWVIRLEVEALLYEKLKGETVKCNVCPRRCYIRPGTLGFCKVRQNRSGHLYAISYGKLTASNVDPIEKKPLYHFWPGSTSYSISSFGCSFACPWCQNWSISQAGPEDSYYGEASPEQVVRAAKRHGCKTISYTYNEPLIWLEYVLDTAKLALKEGILNVLVTNGYTTPEALDLLGPYIQAANVDVKAFNPHFYAKYCKGRLEDVLEALKIMAEKGWHLETTLLIIPTLNDDRKEIRGMAAWIRENLGAETPFHISQFYPTYKMSHLKPTPVGLLVEAREIALREGLKYVYLGNVPGHESENTYCPSCGFLLIKRWGFSILEWNLTREISCSKCGEKIPVKGEYQAGVRSFII